MGESSSLGGVPRPRFLSGRDRRFTEAPLHHFSTASQELTPRQRKPRNVVDSKRRTSVRALTGCPPTRHRPRACQNRSAAGDYSPSREQASVVVPLPFRSHGCTPHAEFLWSNGEPIEPLGLCCAPEVGEGDGTAGAGLRGANNVGPVGRHHRRSELQLVRCTGN